MKHEMGTMNRNSQYLFDYISDHRCAYRGMEIPGPADSRYCSLCNKWLRSVKARNIHMTMKHYQPGAAAGAAAAQGAPMGAEEGPIGVEGAAAAANGAAISECAETLRQIEQDYGNGSIAIMG